jgi:hypothetical protein
MNHDQVGEKGQASNLRGSLDMDYGPIGIPD